MKSDQLGIGVIGCGHWGPNQIRVFSQLKGCSVVAVSDSDEKRLAAVCERFPQLRPFIDYRTMLRDGGVDAIIVAAPTSLHRLIAEDALRMSKHVLCEKPLCLDPADGEALVALAKRKNLILMVGHVFLFNPGIAKVKELIDADEIGEPRYVSAIRTNLGPVRSDVNAVYDLASHDIAIFNWLLEAEPLEVRAMGAAFIQPGIEDVAIITMKYPGNVLASIQCSWLDPKKVRQITVVGSKRMITWDDLALSNPVAIYEKSVESNAEATDYGQFLRLSMLDGDVRLPKVEVEEPLKAQAAAFLRAVREGTAPRSDGAFATGVVNVLSQVQQALNDGTMR
jgi:predicted dehydrogenase